MYYGNLSHNLMMKNIIHMINLVLNLINLMKFTEYFLIQYCTRSIMWQISCWHILFGIIWLLKFLLLIICLIFP